MTKCGCATGGDCTKTTVCQCALEADKLAEALEALVSEIVADKGGEPQFFVLGDAQAALKEYRGNAA